MKLLSIHFPDSKPREFERNSRGIDLQNPNPAHYGWRVLVHGRLVFVIVPTVTEAPPPLGGQPERIAGTYEFPREQCVLRWDSRDPKDYAKAPQDYESEPLKAPGPAAVPEMDQPAKAVGK